MSVFKLNQEMCKLTSKKMIKKDTGHREILSQRKIRNVTKHLEMLLF